MGIRAVFILSRLEPGTLLESLGIERVGEATDVPASDWAGRLKSGWSVIKIEDGDFPNRVTAQIRALSKQGDVMVAIVNESVMYLETTLYSKGAAHWRLEAGNEDSPEPLTIIGKERMPEDLVRHLAVLTADEDFHAVPADAMRIVTGLGYDDWLQPGDFDRLLRVKVPSPRLREHGIGAVLSSLLMRHPLAFLAVGFLLMLVVLIPITLILAGALGTLLEFLLGDWADACLFNCGKPGAP